LEKINLTELIDRDILQQIQDGFSQYAGVAAVTTDIAGIPVTEESRFTDFCRILVRSSKLGRRKCESCGRQGAKKALREGKCAIYCCHAGLIEWASPIEVGGKIIGVFIGGQVLETEQAEERLSKAANALQIDQDIYLQEAKRLPVFSEEKIERAAEFFTQISKAISKIANQNYVRLQGIRKTERVIRSQSDFLMNLGVNMKKNVSGWISCLEQMDSQIGSIACDELKKLLSQGLEVYSMMEDAVEYIKMSQGKAELMETNYSLRELLEQTVHGVRHYLGGECKDIEIVVEEHVPQYFLGDAGRIGQILHKLLVNSASCSRDGKIVLKAASRKISYASMLQLSVENPGMKMSKRQMSEIQQYMEHGTIHDSLKEDNPELGFSLVRLLLSQMSGKIEVSEMGNGGTEVTIILPQLAVQRGDAYGT